MWRKIRNKIKKTGERISFAGYCYPHGDDERFVGNVKMIGKIPELVTLERFDGNGDNLPIYHIYMEESHSGFFADHNRLLAYLYFADYYHLAPVVEYTDKYCYAEEKAVNGTTNPFEYYFEQPVGIGLEDMKGAGVAIRSRKENVSLANSLSDKQEGYTKSEKFLKKMGEISAKYIRLRPEVETYIRDGIHLIFQEKRVLGVHVRGTDFRRNYNGHPIAVTTAEYLDEVKKIMEEKKYEAVFIATDDSSAILMFEDVFKDKLLYYKDVIRSEGNETVMKSENSRENHHYKLGLEVLRDMYTLAACDGLVAGLSQVSYAARIQKISYGKKYEDLRILDKGINYHKAMNCPK